MWPWFYKISPCTWEHNNSKMLKQAYQQRMGAIGSISTKIITTKLETSYFKSSQWKKQEVAGPCLFITEKIKQSHLCHHPRIMCAQSRENTVLFCLPLHGIYQEEKTFKKSQWVSIKLSARLLQKEKKRQTTEITKEKMKVSEGGWAERLMNESYWEGWETNSREQTRGAGVGVKLYICIMFKQIC